MSVVARIEELCKESGTNVWRLEQELEIGNGIIKKWDKSTQSPRVSTLIKIAEHFNVTIDYLVGLTDIRNFDQHLKQLENEKTTKVQEGETTEKGKN